ncbi:hypothetical protein QBC40DRAFT_255575 [Triangularia verruculosa]|uniref:Uncharacterized protein n=1 Tax=Triangularia verruculosa TaxID=2587418 RepID=A0AAN6XEW8_9PEZI|nr:hypothetical protein QBC40DRAFT_255575 [Triangularia verruculosa]
MGGDLLYLREETELVEEAEGRWTDGDAGAFSWDDGVTSLEGVKSTLAEVRIWAMVRPTGSPPMIITLWGFVAVMVGGWVR